MFEQGQVYENLKCTFHMSLSSDAISSAMDET